MDPIKHEMLYVSSTNGNGGSLGFKPLLAGTSRRRGQTRMICYWPTAFANLLYMIGSVNLFNLISPANFVATSGWTWRHVSGIKTTLDVGAWLVAIPIAFVLRLEVSPGVWWQSVMALAVAGGPATFLIARQKGLSRQSWAHVGTRDLSALISAGLLSGLVLFFLASILQHWTKFPVPRSVPVIGTGIAIFLQAGMRLAIRLVKERTIQNGEYERRALIIGAGDIGVTLARELRRNPDVPMRIVGLLDDRIGHQGLTFEGIQVEGRTDDLDIVCARTRATDVYLADASVPAERQGTLAAIAHGHGATFRSIPGLRDIILADSPARVRSVMKSLTGGGAPRHVLVIGGAGYIGSALVPLLLQDGLQVRVLDTFAFGKAPLQVHLHNPDLEIHEGDARNIDVLVDAMQGVDTVVHLGAIVGDPACALDPVLTVETNLMATKMIAEVAKGFGIGRLIFASTCSVYGVSEEILDEESPVNPVSLYARTKVASEKVLHQMASDSFHPIILRFATVYGFSGRTRFDLVINLLAAKAYHDKVITLFGGDQWRPFVHVDDLARGVLAILRTPVDRLAYRVYNVGSNAQNATLLQVAERIQIQVPGSKIVDSGADTDRRNYRVCFDRIHQDTGFKPKWTIDEGIAQVLDALASGRIRDVAAAEYSNVKFLTEGGLSKMVTRVYGSVMDLLDETDETPSVMKADETPPGKGA